MRRVILRMGVFAGCYLLESFAGMACFTTLAAAIVGLDAGAAVLAMPPLQQLTVGMIRSTTA